MRSKKLQRYGIFTALLLVVILWRRSDASPVSLRRRSAKKKVEITVYVGKNSSIVLDKGEGKCHTNTAFPSSPAPSIASGSDAPKCLVLSESCLPKNLTVCLISYNSNTTNETVLSVRNGGDNPLTVSITLLPAYITFSQVELPEHQWKTVNVTEILGAITLIELSPKTAVTNSNGTLEQSPTPAGGSPELSPEPAGILAAPTERTLVPSPAPAEGRSTAPTGGTRARFARNVGVWLFISGVMILAAALAYWKSRAAMRRGRADGIPYERLEVGTANTNSTGGKTSETAEEGGWDQSWGDDGWDEVKVVKSPSRVQKGKCLVNGAKDD